MSKIAARIAENVAAVRERIAQAARRAGADPADITLVAVTKYADAGLTRAVFEAGCTILGESRPQQLWPKAEALRDLPIEWHMIGHLQRNKISRTLPVVTMIQSVDSLRLLEAIDRTAGEQSLIDADVANDPCAIANAPVPGGFAGFPAAGRFIGNAGINKMPLLLEVNISGEADKHGFSPQQMPPLVGELQRFSHVEIRGLMCMASLQGGLDAARRDFAALRSLRDVLAGDCPENVDLRELSMGMSGDFEVAIEMGATIVRVGSALFEGVPL